jgi:TonB family protein
LRNAALTLPVRYHPCAWLLLKAVAESRETVCDAMAADALDGRRSYARSLLRLAMAIPAGLRGHAAAGIGIFEANSLERRMGIMMDRGKQLRGAARLATMTAVLVLTAGAVAGLVGTHLTVRAAVETAGKTHMLHVSAGVMSGNIEKKVPPKYPEEARAQHNTLNGVTTLGLIVNERGLPTDIHVVKSLRKDYDESALIAVRQWRWKPFLLNGIPVPVKTTVNITYSLAN